MSTNRFAVIIIATGIVDRVTVGRPEMPATMLVTEVLPGELVGPGFSYDPNANPRFIAPPDEVPPEEPPEEG